MPPPSPLAIATSSVNRLIKEEASYHRELLSQEARLAKLEERVAKLEGKTDEDENAEYELKQERTAIEETRAVFPPLRQRIADAVAKLEDRLEEGKAKGGKEGEIAAAEETVGRAKEVGK
ncbi:Tubulin chaperone cofactor A [Glarea lozoyensis ATCC 20868]|uniref:Tubulin-specific chaperone A n=1 Tax=Glarea lozoyensis (strain ATCC 20868 / MF5171) TaxID=1116229 RepID=S3CM05_GLAL2|nr:Tubulin chaperone cofactor A [Glarea lozoyensis ATCC 20868]EPE26229.1 Tubulin chaperone cofactor A [Glarea lozoyensis ATCC 20868]